LRVSELFFWPRNYSDGSSKQFRCSLTILQCFQWIQNNIKFGWTLVCFHTVQEWRRNDRDTLRSMITRVFWTTIMTPVYSTKMCQSSEPLHRIPLPLLLWYRHSFETWSSVSSYLVPSCYRQGYSTSFVRFHPHDLFMCCNLDVISPSGPRVSSRHTDEQNPLLTHTPKLIPLDTQIHLYDHLAIVWRLMQPKHTPVIVIRYDLMV
jgi:hypothetical protein